MEFRDLKSFMEVAQAGSYTKAAARSYLTQPSLSKAVKKLEQEMQIQLFERSTRSLKLTDAGEIVFQQGKKVFAAMDEMGVLLDELRDVVTGKIRMGIPPLIGTLFFPNIARDFHQRYPHVSLELVELGAELIRQLVMDGEVDLGIIVLPADEKAFNVYPFIEDEFVLYLHEDHKLARKEAVSIEELRDEQFILFSEGFTLHDYVITACKIYGFVPNISYESSQWDLILELVSSKMGITLLPHAIYQKQTNDNVKFVPLQNQNLLWKLGIITKKDAYHSHALQALLKTLNQK